MHMIICATKPYGNRKVNRCVFINHSTSISWEIFNPHLPTLPTISAALWCHRAVKAGRAAPTAVLNLRLRVGRVSGVRPRRFSLMYYGAAHIWANYNNSLTWNKAILGWFLLLTMIPVRSQWGRYNLPRFIVDFPIYTSIYRLRGGFPASHVWFFRGFFHFNDHQWKTNSRHCHLRPSRGWLDSNCNAPVCLPRICQFVKWWMFAKHIFKRWDTKRH